MQTDTLCQWRNVVYCLGFQNNDCKIVVSTPGWAMRCVLQQSIRFHMVSIYSAGKYVQSCDESASRTRVCFISHRNTETGPMTPEEHFTYILHYIWYNFYRKSVEITLTSATWQYLIQIYGTYVFVNLKQFQFRNPIHPD